MQNFTQNTVVLAVEHGIALRKEWLQEEKDWLAICNERYMQTKNDFMRLCITACKRAIRTTSQEIMRMESELMEMENKYEM